MAFSLFDGKGIPVDDQRFTWRDLVQKPISKLDDDAFTRVRIILTNGLEHEALRFGHMAARFNRASEKVNPVGMMMSTGTAKQAARRNIAPTLPAISGW